MEQFCCEPLSIQGFNITFYPEGTIKRRPAKRLMNVSFINIPPETPEQIVTELLEEYADIEGTPMYVKKNHNGKTYCTGTRVYQINKLYQHIPRRLPNTFGRTIVYIYDPQPEQLEYNQNRRQHRQNNNRKQTYQTPASTTSDTDSDENTDNQWQQQRYHRKKQNQQKRRQNNYNNVTQRKNKHNHQTDHPPHPTPEINTQNYPQLTQQQNQNDTTTSTTATPAEEITVIPEINPIPTT